MTELNSARREVANIPLIESLAARAARLPWWAIIIAGLLGIVFYSFLTSNLYRRALAFVTDDPRLTTTDFANVIYDVRATDSSIQRIDGVVIGQEGENIIVRTQPQQTVNLPRTDIATLTCEPSTCAAGGTATLLRATISGRLLFEDLGRYQITTDDGITVDVRKFTVDTTAVIRQPEGCSPDREGSCRVTLPLKADEADNTLKGSILEINDAQITLETAPEVTTRVNTRDVAQIIRYVPAQCALNNLGACNEGIFLTIFISIISFMVAVVIGLIVGLMRISSNPILFNISTVYVEVLRGIPLVVTLLIVGFGLYVWLRDEFPKVAPFLQIFIIIAAILIAIAQAYSKREYIRIEPALFWQPIIVSLIMGGLLIAVLGWFSANSDLPLITRGILGLSLCYGAYLAELFRAGIQSIGRGQMEAARSLGMNYFQAMRYTILPQAFRVVLPPLGNEFIAMIKDSAALIVLGINEMTQRARIFAADTFRVIEPYITIAVLFLCMTIFLSFMVRTVERHMSLAR